jgi:hypothetical protein
VAPEDRTPPHPQHDTQAAAGGPVGVGAVTYAEAAERLLDNGYEPIPIRPGTKAPIPARWTKLHIDAAQVQRWVELFPDAGVGLRTGSLVGFDLDILDPDLAHAAQEVVLRGLGLAPMRVGLWPKRLFLYRADAPFPRLAIPHVEVLGLGQQLVAYGLHPVTGRPYDWPLGDTPLDTPLSRLALVDRARCEATLTELAAILPAPGAGQRKAQGRRERGGGGETDGAGPTRPERDAHGQVVDGRDGWLSWLAFDTVHERLDLGGDLDAEALADRVWARFAETAVLDRARADGRPWSRADGLRKVRDKLRLHQDGQLPSRTRDRVEPPEIGPFLPVAEARSRLDAILRDACARIADWRRAGGQSPPPRLGLRATVGLGKSVAARRHLDALRQTLAAEALPSRLLWCTPSHALAEEAAAAWAGSCADVAVLRGYEAIDPDSGAPMCRDIAAVRLALLAGLDVQTAACADRNGHACQHFAGCPKQRNRREVAAAEIVVAPYDVLFTGFAAASAELAAIVVDEGCWPRAAQAQGGLHVETLPVEFIDLFPKRRILAALDEAADLHDLRQRLAQACVEGGPGPLGKAGVEAAGLDVAGARRAIAIEKRRLVYGLVYPGMPKAERKAAERLARRNARTRLYVVLWDAVERLLAQDAATDGRIRLQPTDPKTGLTEIIVLGVKALDEAFAAAPILHLDATLRPEFAGTVLPDLTLTEIAADAPHQKLRLVNGPFGKGSLCATPGIGEVEVRRRENTLRACVDYVRWQALRFPGRRALVVTYLGCEAAFAGIPGVEVAHFNAIAGLDAWRDVELLVIVGRPLPSDDDLVGLCAAYFGRAAEGGYAAASAAVAMQGGDGRRVSVRTHTDPCAETLRAAICDDELIQAIGRGRGVNRTADSPLEVHVLANVALPLPHASVQRWEAVAPDVVQRMLLAGVAVDSPADACALHPVFLGNEKQAQKAFERAAFKRQTPMSNPYRGLSLKSAAYRRPGRGRGWQRAYWIDGTAADAKAALERAIGPLAEWRPD